MMRTATLSLLLAVLCISAYAQNSNQDPKQDSKPKPAEPPAQVPAAQVPAVQVPAVAQPEVDPSKMAEPAVNGAAKPPAVSGVDVKSYILGAEDMIFISVWHSPDFSGTHMIRPDGKITIPLIGEVEAAGLTPIGLGGAIQEKLKKVLRDPDVSVSVTDVKSKRYFIEGEVNRPGPSPLVVPTKILEALVNAGGFKDFAKQTDITIMRGNTRLHFNYKNAIKGKDLDKNVYLEPGDIIIVK